MAFLPSNASDSMIESLWEIALRIQKEHAEMMKADPTLAARVDADPELLSLCADRLVEKAMTTTKRHQYKYVQTPVGTDLGWMCYDPDTYDGDPQDGNCTAGYGLTQDAAYADLMHQLDDEKPKPKASRVIFSSPFEPPEYAPGTYQEWEDEDRE